MQAAVLDCFYSSLQPFLITYEYGELLSKLDLTVGLCLGKKKRRNAYPFYHYSQLQSV